MKKLLLSVFISGSLGCSTNSAGDGKSAHERLAPVKTSGGVSSIITNKALASFNAEYIHAPLNRAFAQSDSGAWSWRADRTSIEFAVFNALASCRQNNKKNEESYPCKLIHVNNDWTE